MERNTKITTWQFFSLLLLSRLLSLLTFSPIYTKAVLSSDFLVAGGIGFVFICIASLPIYFLHKKNPDKDILDLSYEISPIFSKIVAVVYGLIFVFYVFSTLARLDLFVGTIIFPESNTFFFVFLSVALACYAASLGLEPLGRAGVMSLFVFALSFLFIFATMVSKVDLNNFSPVFYNGLAPVFEQGWSVTVRFIEIAVMAVLLPRVKGQTKKGFFISILIFEIFFQLVFFFLIGGLGNFAFTQLFPVHAIAVLSEFTVFERLDVILTGVWILSAFIEISFMLYVYSSLFAKAFKPKHTNYYIAAAGAVVVLLQMITSRRISAFLTIVNPTVKTVVFAVAVLIVPLFILVTLQVRRRKKQ